MNKKIQQTIAKLVESKHYDKGFKIDPGYIYLISSLCGKRVKIGKSKQPKERALSIINISGGGEIKFISCAVKNYSIMEWALHKTFDEFRSIGEWFCIDSDDLIIDIDVACKTFIADEQDFILKKNRDEEIGNNLEKVLLPRIENNINTEYSLDDNVRLCELKLKIAISELERFNLHQENIKFHNENIRIANEYYNNPSSIRKLMKLANLSNKEEDREDNHWAAVRILKLINK